MQESSRRILSLALQALYAERQKIEDEIASLEERIGQDSKPRGRSISKPRAKTRISAAGLKAIAEAQRKRWARARALKAKASRSR